MRSDNYAASPASNMNDTARRVLAAAVVKETQGRRSVLFLPPDLVQPHWLLEPAQRDASPASCTSY